MCSVKKGKVLLYSSSVGPGADPVYRQSAHRWLSHPPSGRLPLLSARLAVTFPAEIRTCDLLDHEQLLYCYATQATPMCSVDSPMWHLKSVSFSGTWVYTHASHNNNKPLPNEVSNQCTGSIRCSKNFRWCCSSLCADCSGSSAWGSFRVTWSGKASTVFCCRQHQMLTNHCLSCRHCWPTSHTHAAVWLLRSCR